MPRNARLDVPGALHHIVAQGIQEPIFRTNADRMDFRDRLGAVLEETRTACLAWALMPDHLHLVLKSGHASLSTVMRGLLTGYARGFNRRHRRTGSLFRKRFKSVVCQEETFLLPLVRTVHLDPVRAGLIEDLSRLDTYAWTGHSTLMGLVRNRWQDTRNVLKRFRGKGRSARWAYRAFVQEGLADGRPSRLSGGGLVRSAGGWPRVKVLRQMDAVPPSDERILGDGPFVERTLRLAKLTEDRRAERLSRGMTVEKLATRAARLYGLHPTEIWAGGKGRPLVEARSLMCFWAVRELGLAQSFLVRRLHLSAAAVSKSVRRGGKLVAELGFSLR